MKKLHSIFLLCVLFLWCSCSEEGNVAEVGYLQLGLDKDITVLTKADISISDEPLSVEIKNAQGQVVKKYDNFYAEVSNSRVALPSGIYTVQAFSKKNIKEVGFSQAYYASPVTTVTIQTSEVQTLKLVCTLANVKVSVEYTETIKKFFKKHQATISNEYGSVLFSETEKRAAYFTPNQLSVKLDLVNNTDQTFMVKKEIPNTKAREYYKFRFDVEHSPEGEAGADFNIIIEAMDADTTFILKIPVSDSSFGKEKPVFEGAEWPSFEEGKGTTILQKITSDVGLKSLVLQLPEEIQDITGIYAKDLEISTMSELDLMSLGLTLSGPIFESKEITLNFTELSKKLTSKALETSYPVAIIAKDTLNQITKVIRNFLIKPNGILTLEANAYAKMAYLQGGDFTSSVSSSFGFRYRTKGGQITEVTEGIINNVDKSFTVRVNGLKPNTLYECQAFTNKGNGVWLEFTTEEEKQMPNSRFDRWFQDGKVWYPNVDLSPENYWWDSANPGSAIMSVNPTTEEKTTVVKGSAANLKTMKVDFVGLAAGNVYTGAFGGVDIGTMSASLDFGRPFTSRPSKLEGYYKYNPGIIDYAKAPYADQMGQGDKCSIYILLADWAKPFTVNTGKNQFIDYENDPAIIAMGEIVDGTVTNGSEANGYKKFSIPLVYRNDRKPKYVLVVASASKLGDYFTGSTSSVLLLDEFQLVYDDSIQINGK